MIRTAAAALVAAALAVLSFRMHIDPLDPQHGREQAFLVVSGAAFGPQSSKAGLATVSERIGSVVIAIDRAEEIRFADRIATSTFVLTLVPSR